MVITDTGLAGDALVGRVELLLRSARPGSVIVQLRDRGLSIRSRLELGRTLRQRTRAHGQWLSVNDRIDAAVLLEADALHLGEASVEPADARSLWGDRFLSRACHRPEGADPRGADAVVLSPVVAPRKGAPALGLEGLGRARAVSRGARLVALGGVDDASAPACLDAGADAVAVIGAALDGRDPRPLLAAVGILANPDDSD